MDSSITVLAMRIPKSSKLDTCRSLLFRLWKKGVTVAEIRRMLLKGECKVTDTTLATWFNWKVEAGELPSRKRGAGSASPTPTEPRSLGILDPQCDEDRQARMRRILRIILEPEIAGNADEIYRSLGPLGFNLPLDADGEPDFLEYAKRLGKRRVLSIGDMDFVLLAMWSKKFRATLSRPRIPATDSTPAVQRRELLKLAGKIRGKMLRSVGCRGA